MPGANKSNPSLGAQLDSALTNFQAFGAVSMLSGIIGSKLGLMGNVPGALISALAAVTTKAISNKFHDEYERLATQIDSMDPAVPVRVPKTTTQGGDNSDSGKDDKNPGAPAPAPDFHPGTGENEGGGNGGDQALSLIHI